MFLRYTQGKFTQLRTTMTWEMAVFIFYLILVRTLTAPQGTQDMGPIETISTGRILGKRMTVLDKTVDAFLGIPYGESPVGELRFRKPLPRTSWDGIYNATTYGFGCFQAPDEEFKDFEGSEMWNPNVGLDEDCLNLNVWVPHPRPVNSSVLVWIFGGSFLSGVASLDVYDGKTLAAEEGLVVVSMNFRLAALGFLAMDDPTAPGNQALWDQALALKWVQKNIHIFGGDPDQVTLFGESSGAASIAFHVISPESMNLFRRVALQSASALTPWAYYTMEEGRRRGLMLAEKLKCVEDQSGQTLTTTQMVDCMRTRDPLEIIRWQWVTLDFADFPFVPVVDGDFVRERPQSAMERGEFKNCEVLIGSNTNEGIFFMVYEVPGYSKFSHSPLNRDQYTKAIKYCFPKANTFGFNAIEFEYFPWLSPTDPVALRDAVELAAGDYLFGCPSYEMAVAAASAHNPVYFYRFTDRASNNPWPEWMGVLHGDEIMYIFGIPLHPEFGYNSAEAELSRKMMTYWANFARTGNPNKANEDDPEGDWPLYTLETQEFFTLNKSIINGDVFIGRGPRAKQCAFWREYLPTLVTQTGDISEAERKWKQQFNDWSTKYMVNWKAEFDNYINGKQCEGKGY
ncbi:cholinesterase 2-like [Acanthaster planci]|uniref:Carboxylic ester hydrolase n=1 Tax=Acanthaster planci TaxID=133434 RepID=A0A8B7YRG2_ACAPL|nr:cholinesterase 2-like [Acanthaster planci]XP_022095278.1 cholinesterase 2-like [Acanthaster planci]XP_022095280.1 cholinesterase 2-like [Acanthaster planci]